MLIVKTILTVRVPVNFSWFCEPAGYFSCQFQTFSFLVGVRLFIPSFKFWQGFLVSGCFIEPQFKFCDWGELTFYSILSTRSLIWKRLEFFLAQVLPLDTSYQLLWLFWFFSSNSIEVLIKSRLIWNVISISSNSSTSQLGNWLWLYRLRRNSYLIQTRTLSKPSQ